MTLLKHKVLKGDIVFTEGESQMRGHGFKLFKTEVCQISSRRDWFYQEFSSQRGVEASSLEVLKWR